MGLKSKVIGGLAWTGLALVLVVPSADILSSQLSQKSALSMTSDTDAIETASIGDTDSTKPLPSFLAAPPVPANRTVPVVVTKQPLQVTLPKVPAPAAAEPWMPTKTASLDPVAPVPYPANLRPKAPVVTDPVVVLDDTEVAALQSAEPAVVRPRVNVEPRTITEDELEGWESGTLAEYLEDQGLVDDASYTESEASYDPDGFFLDEGPSDRRVRSRSRRDDDDGYFLVFPDSF